MPDVLITLHSERASRDELLPALPAVRQAVRKDSGTRRGPPWCRSPSPSGRRGMTTSTC